MSKTTPEVTRTARLFRNGRNRAVRIPKELDFAEAIGAELLITRLGDELILSVRPREWSALLTSKSKASNDFLRRAGWPSSRAWAGAAGR